MTVTELIEQLRQAAGESGKGYDAQVHVAGGHYVAAGQKLAVRGDPKVGVVRIGSMSRKAPKP